MNKKHLSRTVVRKSALRRPLLATAIALALVAPTAHAFEFAWGDAWTGSLDTTISYGVSQRLEDRDEDLIGLSNINPTVSLLSNAQQREAPGRFSNNGDDGNLNYDDGDLFSNAFKITSEMSLNYGDDWGGFIRASYFYDFENTDRDELT